LQLQFSGCGTSLGLIALLNLLLEGSSGTGNNLNSFSSLGHCHCIPFFTK
jgi:hypothetical protein